LYFEVALGHACCRVELGGCVLCRLGANMAVWFASCGRRGRVFASLDWALYIEERDPSAFSVCKRLLPQKKMEGHAN
jgi:hypothetical protein